MSRELSLIPFVQIETGLVYFIKKVVKENTPVGEVSFFHLESKEDTLYGNKDFYKIPQESFEKYFAIQES